VKLGKPGGFVGMEAIASRRATDREVLVGLVIQNKRIAREEMDVLHDGRKVGRTTSGTLGPSLDLPICLAYVDKDVSAVGTPLTVDVRGKEALGAVVDGPFYKKPQ